MKKYIYADNAATTKLDKNAYKIMQQYLALDYSNPSQLYSFSRNSKKELLNARKIIAKCINAEPEEIYFTSGGTESNNWIIKQQKEKAYTIITSEIEHKSILESCKATERYGNKVIYLSPDNYGRIKPDNLEKNFTKDTKLVSIMYANNEIGTIQDIKNLASIAHKNNALFHTDAVQAIGHIYIDVKNVDIDFLSASAHKFNGPKGVGFLYIKKGLNLNNFMDGGSQEAGLRAGTENVASIIAMAVALENNCKNTDKNQLKLSKIEKVFFKTLSPNIKYKRNGTNQISGNISLSFYKKDGEAILHRLDLMGIEVSTGSACNSTKKQFSHVLKAINLDKNFINGTIRISFGKYNTVSDAKKVAVAINKILEWFYHFFYCCHNFFIIIVC